MGAYSIATEHRPLVRSITSSNETVLGFQVIVLPTYFLFGSKKLPLCFIKSNSFSVCFLCSSGAPFNFKRDIYIGNACFRSAESGDIVATGGRGDKAIFIYNSTNAGKLERRHKLHGHAGKIMLYHSSFCCC